MTALRAGDTTIYDLKRDPVFNINNPFHSVHFYFPRAALNAIADNAGARRDACGRRAVTLVTRSAISAA